MRRGRILFGTPEGKVRDLLEYVAALEDERDKALAQVRVWNQNTEIRKTKERDKETCRMYPGGFEPNDKQWEKIHAWEEKHTRQYHKTPKIDHPTKRIPNAPDFEYCFTHTHVGTLGRVVCKVCYKKAIALSLGNTALLEKIVDRKGIVYYFGEV